MIPATPNITISPPPGPREYGTKRQSRVTRLDRVRIFTKLGILHDEGAKRLLSVDVREYAVHCGMLSPRLERVLLPVFEPPPRSEKRSENHSKLGRWHLISMYEAVRINNKLPPPCTHRDQ